MQQAHGLSKFITPVREGQISDLLPLYQGELFFTWVITLHSIFDLTSHFICDKSMSQLQNKLAQLAPEIYGVPSHLLCPFSYIPTVKCRHPKTKCSVINMNTRESKTEESKVDLH